MALTTESTMLKKLRAKFIGLICGVAALILSASFAYIAWSAHDQEVKSVYIELGNATESVFDKKPHDSWGGGFDPLDMTAPRIGDHMQHSWPFPIALYTVDRFTQACLLTEGSTASVTDEALYAALTYVMENKSAEGFMEEAGLYFVRSEHRDGSYVVAFADQSVVSDSSRLVKSLVPVALVILLLVFVLAWWFSRWALRPVEHAWEQQQQFIADASHEMKTPLTVILANAAIALKKPQATVAEQSQWIEGIQEEAQNMEQLVLDMLVLAQPQNAEDGSSPARTTVDLSSLVERAILQFEAVAFERGVLMEDAVEPDISLEGDQTALQRLVGTLVDNASKYAPAQTTVTVSLAKGDSGAVLSVHNEGDPISPEDLPHVFDRFYRADKSRDRSGKEGSRSFGLGLAIARKIAEEHGGTLSVTSTKEAGTTFSARFPL